MKSLAPSPASPTPSAIREIAFETADTSSDGTTPNTMWIGGSWGTGRARYHLLMRTSLPAPKQRRSSAPKPAAPDTDHASAEVPLSDKWITPSLLAYTREVWTEFYGREVDAAEAIEILGNVRTYAEVMLEAQALTEAAP